MAKILIIKSLSFVAIFYESISPKKRELELKNILSRRALKKVFFDLEDKCCVQLCKIIKIMHVTVFNSVR